MLYAKCMACVDADIDIGANKISCNKTKQNSSDNNSKSHGS